MTSRRQSESRQRTPQEHHGTLFHGTLFRDSFFERQRAIINDMGKVLHLR